MATLIRRQGWQEGHGTSNRIGNKSAICLTSRELDFFYFPVAPRQWAHVNIFMINISSPNRSTIKAQPSPLLVNTPLTPVEEYFINADQSPGSFGKRSVSLASLIIRSFHIGNVFFFLPCLSLITCLWCLNGGRRGCLLLAYFSNGRGKIKIPLTFVCFATANVIFW